MRFEFATASRIIFGPNTIHEIGDLVKGFGTRALLVTAGFPELAATLLDTLSGQGVDLRGLLEDAGVTTTLFPVANEPTVALVQEGTRLARESGCEFIVAIGGGSAIDAGKAISALLANGGHPLDYLEVIGQGQPLTKPAVPCIAIPTTAGTGAEVTRNAVLLSAEHRVKVSLRSPLMLPRIALVDPVLTHSLPPGVTASTGLDALTQVLEPYVSNKANPLTDALCREGLGRAARSLRRAFEDGSDAAAREDMALTSLFGGLALANAKLGAVHGFAGPIGGMFHAPHGVVCARLLPHAIEMNVRALSDREPSNPALRRFDEIAQILTGDSGATAADGVAWIQDVCDALRVPPLANFGISETDFGVIVQKSAVASSMKGNPIHLTAQELEMILRQAV